MCAIGKRIINNNSYARKLNKKVLKPYRVQM